MDPSQTPPAPEPTSTVETTADDSDERTEPSSRRPLDPTSLIAGILVLAVVAVFAIGDPDSLRDQGRVVGPLVLLGIGAALLLGSLRR